MGKRAKKRGRYVDYRERRDDVEMGQNEDRETETE